MERPTHSAKEAERLKAENAALRRKLNKCLLEIERLTKLHINVWGEK
jgi:hypothetical protein